MGTPLGLCSACKWWGAETAERGTCRVDNPTLVSSGGYTQPANKTQRASWPWCNKDDWCGKWQQNA